MLTVCFQSGSVPGTVPTGVPAPQSVCQGNGAVTGTSSVPTGMMRQAVVSNTVTVDDETGCGE